MLEPEHIQEVPSPRPVPAAGHPKSFFRLSWGESAATTNWKTQRDLRKNCFLPTNLMSVARRREPWDYPPHLLSPSRHHRRECRGWWRPSHNSCIRWDRRADGRLARFLCQPPCGRDLAIGQVLQGGGNGIVPAIHERMQSRNPWAGQSDRDGEGGWLSRYEHAAFTGIYMPIESIVTTRCS